VSFLDQLTVATVTRSSLSKNPEERSRQKFLKAVQLQCDLVSAEIAKKTGVPPDAADGAGEGAERKRIIRWYEKISGKYYTSFKYGMRDIELKGAKTFLCGPALEDILNVYAVITQATEAGELDEVFADMARVMSLERRPADAPVVRTNGRKRAAAQKVPERKVPGRKPAARK
jgi:hypothetical protein